MAYPTGGFLASITVDSCIIEDQPDHLVFAIRVPKATIVDNASFLECVLEHVKPDRTSRTIEGLSPVLAGIAAHEVLFAELERVGVELNTSPDEEDGCPAQIKFEEASGAERKAFWKLLATEPQTPAECQALVRYIAEVGMKKEADGHHDDGPEMLFANLRKAAVGGLSAT